MKILAIITCGLLCLIPSCATTAPSWETGISADQVGRQQFDLRLRGQF